MKRNDEEMTGREAAKFLGVSYMTFMRRVKDNKIAPIQAPNPALKKQRSQTFRRADVEKLRGA